MIKLNIELNPFNVPNYVMVKQKVSPREEGVRLDAPKYHVRDLDAETLHALCDEFRENVFKNAEMELAQNKE